MHTFQTKGVYKSVFNRDSNHHKTETWSGVLHCWEPETAVTGHSTILRLFGTEKTKIETSGEKANFCPPDPYNPSKLPSRLGCRSLQGNRTGFYPRRVTAEIKFNFPKRISQGEWLSQKVLDHHPLCMNHLKSMDMKFRITIFQATLIRSW